MTNRSRLPPGQRAVDSMPRFGLTKFAYRFPDETNKIAVHLGGDCEPVTLNQSSLAPLSRINQTSDFHCVTTWSKCDLDWSGFRFSDFYQRIVAPRLSDSQSVKHVVIHGQDGYRTGMYFDDMMAPEVLLADRLNEKPLSVAHGAPLRLVAPAHYGYKCVKHIKRIDFWTEQQSYRRAAFNFMDHPRARVGREERGLFFPGWLLRGLYRPLVTPTIRRFKKALDEYVPD